jgi:exopolysaccharide production protein ExoZ
MKIHSIQYLRGFAAILVVYVHLTMTFFTRNFCGAIGVDLFFVTSGFIIAFSVAKLDKNWNGAIMFIKRRLKRVYPLYFTITVCFATILFSFRQYSGTLLVHQTILSLLFLPTQLPNHDPVIFTGWSLFYEIFFYIMVALCIGLFKSRYRLMLLIILLICGTAGLFYNSQKLYFDFFISPFFLEFCFGFLIFMFLYNEFSFPNFLRKAIFMIALVGFFIAAFLGRDNGYEIIGFPRELIFYKFLGFSRVFPRAIVWGVPSALLFASTILAFNNIRAIKWLEYLGNISYSIYLVQVPVVFFYYRYLPYVHSAFNVTLYALFTFILILLISIISYRLIEQEILFKYIRNKFTNA